MTWPLEEFTVVLSRYAAEAFTKDVGTAKLDIGGHRYLLKEVGGLGDPTDITTATFVHAGELGGGHTD